jgi:hypothetical protein
MKDEKAGKTKKYKNFIRIPDKKVPNLKNREQKTKFIRLNKKDWHANCNNIKQDTRNEQITCVRSGHQFLAGEAGFRKDAKSRSFLCICESKPEPLGR